MSWTIKFIEVAYEDLKKLDNSQRVQILKGIRKVSQNPLPQSEGGYGKSLGNQKDINLIGLLKIKFKNLGIRVVYKIQYTESAMLIIVVSIRDDDEVYRLAQKRRVENDL